MEHGARTRIVTAVVLAAVFGAGVLVGLAAKNSNVDAEAAEVTAQAPDTAATPRSRAPKLYERVEPNETQLALIDSIVAKHRAAVNALDEERREDVAQARDRYQSEFRSIVLDTREAIKHVLTPEQAAEYQRILDAWDAEKAAQRENEDEKD